MYESVNSCVYRLLMKRLNFVIVQVAPITVVGSQSELHMGLLVMERSIIPKVLRAFMHIFLGSRYRCLFGPLV